MPRSSAAATTIPVILRRVPRRRIPNRGTHEADPTTASCPFLRLGNPRANRGGARTSPTLPYRLAPVFPAKQRLLARPRQCTDRDEPAAHARVPASATYLDRGICSRSGFPPPGHRDATEERDSA